MERVQGRLAKMLFGREIKFEQRICDSLKGKFSSAKDPASLTATIFSDKHAKYFFENR